MLKPRPQPAEDTMYKMEDDEVIKGEPAEGRFVRVFFMKFFTFISIMTTSLPVV